MSALQRYVPVPDGAGGWRHELRAVDDVPAAKGRKRKAYVPDPIKASGEASAQMLRQYIERAEGIMGEIAEMQADLHDVFSEAKGQGLSPSTMRLIMARRKKEKHILDEDDAIFEAYMTALGMN